MLLVGNFVLKTFSVRNLCQLTNNIACCTPRVLPSATAERLFSSAITSEQNESLASRDEAQDLESTGIRSKEEEALDAAALKAQLKDRSKIIPVETSIKYLKSEAYRQTYGNNPVWVQYRRNHKGMYAPRKTRKTCIRKNVISTGNPCPICRDEYLVLDHRNLELIRQFISPQNGQVISYSKTGLCQKKHLQLLVAVERAWDQGLLEFDVPFREFDYAEYYPKELIENCKI